MWVDGYLIQYAEAVLTSGSTPPRFAGAYLNNVPITNTTVFADLGVDVGHQVNVQSSWTFNLLPVSHQAVASQTVTFNFPAGLAGRLYYGVALYTPANQLSWALAFVAPYTVPPGGGSLVVNLSQQFSDCAFS